MTLQDIDIKKISPMMRQYVEAKQKYSQHVLFFRVGDFYEMFFDDALRVSKLLELTLTGKECGLQERAPMCGIPHHAADIYIKKLVELGEKVAVCEQLTDPSESKGLVERDVIKIVTPGTVTDSTMLDEASNNYLAAVYAENKEICSVCFTDISTGTVVLFTLQGKEARVDLINHLSRFSPAEILMNQQFLDWKEVTGFIREKLRCSIQLRDDSCFFVEDKAGIVAEQFNVSDLKELGLTESGSAACCVCGLFDYIQETQKAVVGRFTSIEIYADNRYMGLNLTARRNLELTETLRTKERKGSLLWVLDHTRTSMGKRLLRNYIEQPLLQPAPILERLNAVESLCHNFMLQQELTEALNHVYDLERLMTRVMYKTATPRDLKSLSATALYMPEIKRLLSQFETGLLSKCNENISTLSEISNLIENAIVDEPPVSTKEGGMIREGFHKELDELRHIINNGRDVIASIEQREKDATGIKNLKIGYNRVFGYYIEVTKSYYNLVPSHYIRKQTLSNCERFITEELKTEENKILGANDKVLVLEMNIFGEIRDFIATQLTKVQKTAEALAIVDVLCSFAYAAINYNYVKPDIAIDGIIEIKDGRHPVVELMRKDEVFVPNDTWLDTKERRMSVITGPNMSGKSTYMRQVALITLMAQIGCFVPASRAKISIVDQIFTRVGASDDLAAGQSTFMVEMMEVADILKHATKKSLVILDEVGRGTSTFDGISIAQAVAEQIADKKLGCKTLFATHYHELIALENQEPGVKNYSVAVQKRGENIRFLHKIVPGGVDDSYGIEVAKLAGIPAGVIQRARVLLKNMETHTHADMQISSVENHRQLSFSHMDDMLIVNRLRKTNIDELSPEEAKEFLKELVRHAGL